jgi:hypothetical protein
LWGCLPLSRTPYTRSPDLLARFIDEENRNDWRVPDNRPYKLEKWRKRLMIEEEKAEERRFYDKINKRDMEALKKRSTKDVYASRGAGETSRQQKQCCPICSYTIMLITQKRVLYASKTLAFCEPWLPNEPHPPPQRLFFRILAASFRFAG